MLNLTGKKATQKLLRAGVIDPTDTTKKRITEILTFSAVPMAGEFQARANGLFKVVERERQHITCTDEIVLSCSCISPLALCLYKVFTTNRYDVYFEYNGSEIVEAYTK